MAIFNGTNSYTLTAGEDLRTDGIGTMLKLENDGGVAKVIKVTATTDTPVGFLAEVPDQDISSDGEPVAVVTFGPTCKGIAGATITAGQLLISDATAGRLTGVADQDALAANVTAVGVALESGVDGQVIEFLMQLMTSSASA